MFRIKLVVRPRDGVRDPQGDAVQEALRGMGYVGVRVHGVGRTLQMDLDAADTAHAQELAQDMCRRLLVNPNLETFEITVEALA